LLLFFLFLINLYKENLFFLQMYVFVLSSIFIHTDEKVWCIYNACIQNICELTCEQWGHMWRKVSWRLWYWMTGKQQYNTLLKVEIGFKILAKNNKTCLD
jgi:hypothetical protein